MPSYKTHVLANFCLGLPLSLAALKYSVQITPADAGCFVGAFIYGTLFLRRTLTRVFWLCLILICLGALFPQFIDPTVCVFAIVGLASADLFRMLLNRVF